MFNRRWTKWNEGNNVVSDIFVDCVIPWRNAVLRSSTWCKRLHDHIASHSLSHDSYRVHLKWGFASCPLVRRFLFYVSPISTNLLMRKLLVQLLWFSRVLVVYFSGLIRHSFRFRRASWDVHLLWLLWSVSDLLKSWRTTKKWSCVPPTTPPSPHLPCSRDDTHPRNYDCIQHSWAEASFYFMCPLCMMGRL